MESHCNNHACFKYDVLFTHTHLNRCRLGIRYMVKFVIIWCHPYTSNSARILFLFFWQRILFLILMYKDNTCTHQCGVLDVFTYQYLYCFRMRNRHVIIYKLDADDGLWQYIVDGTWTIRCIIVIFPWFKPVNGFDWIHICRVFSTCIIIVKSS